MRPFITATTFSNALPKSLIIRRWRPQWIDEACNYTWAPSRKLATTATTTDEERKPYYITTPIFYVNAAPHVGHMYTMILTDVIKRWQQLKGRKAILCTGTDEHGMKIQRAAAKADMEPKAFCDKGADIFKELAGKIDISNDTFIRTTDRKHREAVEYAWQMLEQRGYIYESKHEGWYSVSDETFYPKGQVQLIVDPPTGKKIMVSIETGKEVEWTSERNYHFRLGAFRERLLDFYENNPDFIVPKKRMSEIVNQVSSGLEDLSVSRPVERLSWGIRVPTDSSQTMYVWLDALLNYATAAGYPFAPDKEHAGGWPADLHVIGKDIVRFHCIYWPAFLMALDLPLPKQVLTHAHWTLGKQKMAKSTGNVVNPFFALERFGLDAVRWYLIHEGGINDDADYDNIWVIAKYKKGLQGGLGNLTTRIMRGKGWNVRRAVQRYAHPGFNLDPDNKNKFPAISDESHTRGRRLYGRLRSFPRTVDQLMVDLFPNKALQEIMSLVHGANAFMQELSPWTTAAKLKELRASTSDTTEAPSQESDEATVLEAEIDRAVYLCAEVLRLVGISLQPFIPDAARRLLNMLGVHEDKRDWKFCYVGSDDSYGVPMVALGKGVDGVLFPGLTSNF